MLLSTKDVEMLTLAVYFPGELQHAVHFNLQEFGPAPFPEVTLGCTEAPQLQRRVSVCQTLKLLKNFKD